MDRYEGLQEVCGHLLAAHWIHSTGGPLRALGDSEQHVYHLRHRAAASIWCHSGAPLALDCEPMRYDGGTGRRALWVLRDAGQRPILRPLDGVRLHAVVYSPRTPSTSSSGACAPLELGVSWSF